MKINKIYLILPLTLMSIVSITQTAFIGDVLQVPVKVAQDATATAADVATVGTADTPSYNRYYQSVEPVDYRAPLTIDTNSREHPGTIDSEADGHLIYTY